MSMTEELAGYLFAERKASTYAILDGASVSGLLDQLYKHEPEFECLYRGDIGPDLAEVAPYLIKLEPKSVFTDWVLNEGWGSHWGVFAIARTDLPTLRRHFRRFLTVHTEQGKPVLFRYYDPRVLRVYLPTCNSEELGVVFGPILHYILESEVPEELLRFQCVGDKLLGQKKRISAES
jgi:hypothetical protein